MTKKKIGRPTDAPKNKTIKFRIDEETNRQLEYCSDKLNTSKSQILREGVHKIYGELDKE